MKAKRPPGPRRDRAGWLAVALLVAAVVAVYAPLAGRGFASEDFLLIRVLRQQPPWHDWTALFAGPWLGIEVVRFYRPLSLLLLAVEARLFGGHPLPYGLVHLTVHLVNVMLVYRLVGRLASHLSAPDRRPDEGRPDEGPSYARHAPSEHDAALVAALLFAIYPLSPNAVSWIASYATLFAATAVLAAAVSWEAWRAGAGAGAGAGAVASPLPVVGREAATAGADIRSPVRRRPIAAYAASLAAFVAGLLCYEVAVVLPVVLLLRELLVPDGPPSGRPATGETPSPRRRRLLATLPFFAAAGLYLLARGALLGAVVGGYGSFAERFTVAGSGRLLRDAVTSLFRLVQPLFGRPPASWAPWTVLLFVLTLPLLHRLAGGRSTGSARRELGRWLFAWGWMAAFLAPFAFQPFVPANGRFAYLAGVGAALALAQLARLAWRARRGRPGRRPWGVAAGWLVVAFVVLVVGGWAVLLLGLTRAMERAGETAAVVADELRAVAAEAPAGPLFVAGHPRFIRSAAGVPLAQVLRYGLADALEPPFTPRSAAAHGVHVYPLPEGPVDGALAALAAAHPALRNAPVVTWDPATGRFEPPAPPPATAAAPRRLAVSGPDGDGRVTCRPVAGAASYRLVVLTRGNPAVVPLAPPPTGARRPTATLPADFVASMRHLYAGPLGGPVFWWIEARDPAGRLIAVSSAAALPVEDVRRGR